MRLRIVVGGAGLAWALAGPLAAQTVGGLVWDGISGRPVPAARVYGLDSLGVPVAGPVLTGADGRFALTDVGSGSLLLVASKEGWAGSPPVPVVEGATGVLLEIRPLPGAGAPIRVSEGAGGSSDGARILGWVQERDSGRPLTQAEIEVVGTGRRVATDSNGMFVLEEVPPGEVALAVSHLSFATAGTVLRVEAGRAYQVRATLTPEAIGLEGIEVTARSSTWYRQMDGLRFRMSRGLGGDFVTADQLRRRGYPPLIHALRDMPSVRLRKAGVFHYDVRFRGCERPPVLYIDGVQVNQPENLEPLRELSELASADVEAMEIYRGPGSLPPEFAGPDSMCGAIVVWTRRGG